MSIMRSHNMEDNELIKACLKGNSKAQRLLFEKFSPLMMGVVLRYVSSKEKANDVLQDGFIKVFKNLDKFNNQGSFEGWIRRIIINTALDQLRKDKKFQKEVEIDDVSLSLSIDSNAIDLMQAEGLMQLIQGLPEGYRTVFNLYAIEGYTHKEIGEFLDIAENTSKSQYSRARALLRDILKKAGIEREG